jgi:protein SCO1/2
MAKGDTRVALRSLLALALSVGGCALTQDPAREPAPPAPSSDPSLYARRWTWTDELGKSVQLDRWRGKPLVVTAVFTTCKATCPRTIERLRKVHARFLAERRDAKFVLVTLDPANDTPERMRRFKAEQGLPASWTFLAGDKGQTRELLEMLGIHLMNLDDHIMHDGAIVVFDERGVASRSYTGWGLDEEAPVI